MKLMRRYFRDRRYRALVEQERNSWTHVSAGGEWLGRETNLVIRWVLEQNGLGERRLRVIHQRDGYTPTSKLYSDGMLWVEMANHTMPPRHEPEVRYA